MKQLLQNVRDGELSLVQVPTPVLHSGGLLVRTAVSVISAGTEKMITDLARKSLVGKARSRPDLARQVISKAKKEGLLSTYRTVVSRLEKPMPLGYSAAGVVEAVGEDVTAFQPGDRVAMAGAGYANHAEMNFVPQNLVARIPGEVSFRDAAYTTIGSIALQGVRIARPELGSSVAVIGLGLIGLLTVQLLKANGCRVLGVDIDAAKTDLARRMGADVAVSSASEASNAVAGLTDGYGVDAVIITAGTDSNEPVELAGELSRRKGRVVVVGAVRMDVPRTIYYEKELELLLSMSYGPGRYDPTYEEGGIDYPFEYVRWTENRNMQAFLGILQEGRLDIDSLTTHHFSFDAALDAYELIDQRTEPFVGVVLEYEVDRVHSPLVRVRHLPPPQQADLLSVALVGAGNYATRHILPHLKSDSAVRLRAVMTATGPSSKQKAEKFGFEYCTTDLDAILTDDAVDAVFVATSHSTHAGYVEKVLRAGKHVFVEKPLVVNHEELIRVDGAYTEVTAGARLGLMVGLNRRFSPMVDEIEKAVKGSGPLVMTYRVNAGPIPLSSWLYSAEEGGGMLVGEMCHFVDVMQYLAHSQPIAVFADSIRTSRRDVCARDNLSMIVRFEDGSIGTLSYSTLGDAAAPKERLEVLGGGIVAQLDDFRRLSIVQGGRSRRSRSWNQDKGQAEQIGRTVEAFRTKGQAPIPYNEIIAGMRVIFAAAESLQTGRPVHLSQDPRSSTSTGT